MKVKPITNIETAIRIYYSHPEIGNAEIVQLFGKIAGSTISMYKKAVLEEQAKRGVKTSYWHSVNTENAYEVWGIDVEDLLRRRAKLKKLGMLEAV